ncbi:MAG TPA: hypothetical protein VFW91_08430 [Candidatus Binatia bacterium]|nr:hypothetical protein [Candidatus Binatia bacterium]
MTKVTAAEFVISSLARRRLPPFVPSLAGSSGATGGPALGRKFRQSASQELEPH